MAHKKAGGTVKNLRDSNPKYLGTKKYDGETVKRGFILVRQRGTKIQAGRNVRRGKDYTLFAAIDGTVRFRTIRKKAYTGHVRARKEISVMPAGTK
ncbi:MAG: 50S ribosomal protein L27 [Parcubacteria group bacterium]|nr:50S ribosomal protein L27 [Parcubacteria group bacterium]